MLYVKIDESGNPQEPPKSYAQIVSAARENGNVILPAESVFQDNLANFSYGLCPYVDPPVPATGNKLVLGVPTKNSDGTYQRVFTEEKATEIEIENRELAIRNERLRVLNRFIDTISPVRWSAMSDVDKAAVSAYRQQLLDLPSATGFPFIQIPPLPSVLT